MSWRTIYIESQCHLSYKNNYLVIRKEDVSLIHLSEISTIVIDNNSCTMTCFLMNKLIENKIKVIICDLKHNPSFEFTPYHSAYNSSQQISKQISWEDETCKKIWQLIIKSKITKQAQHLKIRKLDEHSKLDQYIKEVEMDDSSNREGHAAKVYFNALFGKNFNRDADNDTNSYLNYGYSVLLSMFNKEVANCGYLTQIGLHHKGIRNPFNLSCDLMEPFRIIVDKYTYDNLGEKLTPEKKIEIIKVLNGKYLYNGKYMYLNNIINLYVGKVIEMIETGNIEEKYFDYGEKQIYEDDSVF